MSVFLDTTSTRKDHPHADIFTLLAPAPLGRCGAVVLSIGLRPQYSSDGWTCSAQTLPTSLSARFSRWEALRSQLHF